MAIEQTVEIPANGILHLDIVLPEPVAAIGMARLFIQIPEETAVFTAGEDTAAAPVTAKGQSKDEAFRRTLRRSYGAWKDKPWENSASDIRAIRDEWAHRDPWNPDPAERHRV